MPRSRTVETADCSLLTVPYCTFVVNSRNNRLLSAEAILNVASLNNKKGRYSADYGTSDSLQSMELFFAAAWLVHLHVFVPHLRQTQHTDAVVGHHVSNTVHFIAETTFDIFSSCPGIWCDTYYIDSANESCPFSWWTRDTASKTHYCIANIVSMTYLDFGVYTERGLPTSAFWGCQRPRPRWPSEL